MLDGHEDSSPPVIEQNTRASADYGIRGVLFDKWNRRQDESASLWTGRPDRSHFRTLHRVGGPEKLGVSDHVGTARVTGFQERTGR